MIERRERPPRRYGDRPCSLCGQPGATYTISQARRQIRGGRSTTLRTYLGSTILCESCFDRIVRRRQPREDIHGVERADAVRR